MAVKPKGKRAAATLKAKKVATKKTSFPREGKAWLES